MTLISKQSGIKYTLRGSIHNEKQMVLVPVKSTSKNDFMLVSKFSLKHHFEQEK
jgi:hypothetical protein